jgi:hypothetical protein
MEGSLTHNQNGSLHLEDFVGGSCVVALVVSRGGQLQGELGSAAGSNISKSTSVRGVRGASIDFDPRNVRVAANQILELS